MCVNECFKHDELMAKISNTGEEMSHMTDARVKNACATCAAFLGIREQADFTIAMISPYKEAWVKSKGSSYLFIS